MRNFINWLRTPMGIIVIAASLLVLSGIFIGVGRSMQSSTIGYEVEHSARPVDAGVVNIVGREVLSDGQLNELRGRILNNVYKEHYQRSGLVERTAKYESGLQSAGEGAYMFQIKFIPSNTMYFVDISTSSKENSGFTVSVREEE